MANFKSKLVINLSIFLKAFLSFIFNLRLFCYLFFKFIRCFCDTPKPITRIFLAWSLDWYYLKYSDILHLATVRNSNFYFFLWLIFW